MAVCIVVVIIALVYKLCWSKWIKQGLLFNVSISKQYRYNLALCKVHNSMKKLNPRTMAFHSFKNQKLDYFALVALFLHEKK